MNDTRPEVRRRVREFYEARTPAERLAMASEMSVAARRLAEAGVRAELGEHATNAEVFRAVFLRFYARELGPARANAIVDAIVARRAAR